MDARTQPLAWLRPVDLAPLPLALLVVAAIAVGVGGYEHAHLFHQGYREIHVIGTLFILNAIGSLIVILLLIFRRPLGFVVGSLAVSLGSIAAIIATRNGGLFGFEEAGYDARARLTLAAEIVAVLLTLAGAAVAGRRLWPPTPPVDPNDHQVIYV